MTDPERRDALIAAIRAFPFWDYGLDDVDPHSEYAEWVPDLADAVISALATPETSHSA